MQTDTPKPPVYYSAYLQLDTILNAQLPESDKAGIVANDEMLFIIIHQTYELWFKQILFEINIIRDIFNQKAISDNSPDLNTCVHRLNRIVKILEVAVAQIDILATMTPLDFLDFRDLLRPASGFQSIQFKLIEAALGLKYANRHGQAYYLSQLTPQDVEKVQSEEAKISLLVLICQWLERMPFTTSTRYWQSEEQSFWAAYRYSYIDSLSPAEQQNITAFDALFSPPSPEEPSKTFSAQAAQNALFILLYRDYPMLQQPYRLLNALIDIDQQMSLWRHKHIHLVERTIGKRVGTGGSTGAQYLKGAADSHYIFKDISVLTSFLLPRASLPALPLALVKDLSFMV